MLGLNATLNSSPRKASVGRNTDSIAKQSPHKQEFANKSSADNTGSAAVSKKDHDSSNITNDQDDKDTESISTAPGDTIIYAPSGSSSTKSSHPSMIPAFAPSTNVGPLNPNEIKPIKTNNMKELKLRDKYKAGTLPMQMLGKDPVNRNKNNINKSAVIETDTKDNEAKEDAQVPVEPLLSA